MGAPVNPWITKMLTQDTKLEHQGIQNPSFVYKRSSISVVNQPALPRSQGGRRQGRSLKIRRTPSGEQGVMKSGHHSAESAITGGPAPAAGPSKIRAQNASFFKLQFQHAFFQVKSTKNAKSAKKCALSELRRAPKNVKSETNCYSRAPSDLFRK